MEWHDMVQACLFFARLQVANIVTLLLQAKLTLGRAVITIIYSIITITNHHHFLKLVEKQVIRYIIGLM